MLNAKMAVRAATGTTDRVGTPAQHESIADSLSRIADLLRLVRGQFLQARILRRPHCRNIDHAMERHRA